MIQLIRRSLRARLTAILLALVLIPLVFVSAIEIGQTRQALERKALDEIQLVTDLNVQETQRFLTQFEADLLSMSQTPPIQAIIRAQDNGGIDPIDNDSYETWVNRLNQIFTSFATSKKMYQQLRYLDQTGQELVRVDFDGQRALVFSGTELQNKGNRPYFVETMQLQRGEIYVSPLEPNQEAGNVQLPLVPVLRYATPIFDPAGNRRGIAILNIYAASFLEKLSRNSGQTYLANQAGYYLKHPDPTYEFGFQLGTNFNIQQDFGLILAQLGARDAVIRLDVPTDTVVNLQKIYFDSRQPDRYWLLIKTLPREQIFVEINALTAVMAGIAGVVAVLVVIIAFFVVRNITEPINLLAQASKQMTEGDLSVSLPINRDDEIGLLATSFSQMANEIEVLVTSLEERVADRTQRLETAAVLAERLSGLLHREQLLIEIVRQINDAYGYYHTQIYLLDESGEHLVLAQGAGESSRVMEANYYKVALDTPTNITRAVSNKEIVRIDDVREQTDWVPDPFLPEVCSEMVVPIMTEERVLGVLDVQQNTVAALDDSDAHVLRSIANQIGIALQNAQLYEEREAIIHQLKAVDKAKSQFITMISHELRTPLSAINGFAELLLLGLSGDVSKDAQNDIQHIHNNGQHLLSLINDIIDITQIEREEIVLKPEQLDVAVIVEGTLANTNSLVGEKPLQMVSTVPTGLPLVWADPTRLKQVLFNLVENAIKFTNEGNVTVTAAVDETQSKILRVAVQDTGIGIPTDKLEQIFNMFEQADMSDGRQYGGVGLGLSICAQLVRLHGGQIGVISQKGQGSEFWFTLPLIDEA